MKNWTIEQHFSAAGKFTINTLAASKTSLRSGSATTGMPFIDDTLLWCPDNDGRMVDISACLQVKFQMKITPKKLIENLFPLDGWKTVFFMVDTDENILFPPIRSIRMPPE